MREVLPFERIQVEDIVDLRIPGPNDCMRLEAMVVGVERRYFKVDKGAIKGAKIAILDDAIRQCKLEIPVSDIVTRIPSGIFRIEAVYR